MKEISIQGIKNGLVEAEVSIKENQFEERDDLITEVYSRLDDMVMDYDTKLIVTTVDHDHEDGNGDRINTLLNMDFQKEEDLGNTFFYQEIIEVL